jgi:hypothetical protein
MPEDLTATIGERIAARGIDVHDIRGELMTRGSYPRLSNDRWVHTAIHYTAAERGVRSVAGDIASWQGHAKHHVVTNGWPGIAYAIGVSMAGRVYLLRDVEQMGYHAFNANASSLGLSADMGTQQPSAALLRGYEAIVRVLHEQTPELPNLVREQTWGHRELTFLDSRNSGTLCPAKLLPYAQRYRAGSDFDGSGELDDPNDAALERLYLEMADELGPKRVPGAGELKRDWAGAKVLLCQNGALAARDGVAWPIVAYGMDDLVTYWQDDGSLTLYE